MRKHLISFAQVINILQNIKLKGGGVNPKTPLCVRPCLLVEAFSLYETVAKNVDVI